MFSLETAVAKVQIFYALQKRNSIPATVAAQTLGYSAKNTEGARALATLLSFGLFEDDTVNNVRHVKVAAPGMSILRNENQPALRLPALREAAMKPPIYSEA